MVPHHKGLHVIAVLFESKSHPGKKDAYLDAGARLAPVIEHFDGFLGIELFESRGCPIHS
jgi:hypothetical protein